LALALTGCSKPKPEVRHVPDAAAQEHIRQVIDSLPVDSSLRRTLEAGRFGNGIHEPWMDDMRREGVKEVALEVRGRWLEFFGFSPKKVARILYRSKYEGPKAQITDSAWLGRIRASGLEQELEAVALGRAKRATPMRMHWDWTIWERGSTHVYLFDDEWLVDMYLWSDYPIFASFDPDRHPLYVAVVSADEARVSSLLAERQFGQEDLDGKLFAAVETFPSDNTDVIRLLLKAGANVNARRDDGSTVLMRAVSSYKLSDCKLLLASGADVNAKNSLGRTTLAVLENRIALARRSGELVPEYVPDIVELLKQAGAHD